MTLGHARLGPLLGDQERTLEVVLAHFDPDLVHRGLHLTIGDRALLGDDRDRVDLLQERGWSREQAYELCSVAADLRISNVVDVPNYVVSALIPEAIFGG